MTITTRLARCATWRPTRSTLLKATFCGVVAAAAVTVPAGQAFAAGTYATTNTVNVRSGPSTGYGVIGTVGSNSSFALLCQWQGGTNIGGNATWDRVQFGNGLIGAISDYYTTTPSWNTYAPGTGDCNSAVTAQMQAAANWAIAEKNSPDPTWSDHYGHAWSGWCEQFAEQAEGFRFQFASAIADYQWRANNGRIHTDANPPVGALVFYADGGGYGHVAVSIGGGQEVGTVGYVGQRLAVRQYPVIGYLSNRYLGWANPIGS